jgi:PmbA protein
MNDRTELLAVLVARAVRAGADAADALLACSASLSVSVRHGVTEHLERSENQDLGLRVFLGQQAAVVSATSLDPKGFDRLVERAIAMARVVPADIYAGLAAEMTPPENIDLDLDDGQEPSAESLIERARAAEDAARAVAGVTNTEGADTGFGRSEMVLATSAGFIGRQTRSSHSISAVALAGEGVGMQRDYDFSSAVYLSDLDTPEAIGRSAGTRAVRRLNPARPKTAKLTVVFDQRVSGSILSHVSGAVNGSSVARGTSLFKDRMGERIFAPGISIIDDPRRVRGLRSRVFDGEGVATRRLAIIEDGVLRSWLLDSRSARQLGLTSTGHASRSTGSPPSPSSTNLYMAPGTLTPAELMADIKEGLYVTELLGGGMNGVTGDYSRGAAGFMIRDGVLAEPVAEFTIAGHGLEMFAHLTPANDLVFRRGTDAPTLRIEGLTLAGA